MSLLEADHALIWGGCCLLSDRTENTTWARRRLKHTANDQV